MGILQLTCWVVLPGFVAALPAPGMLRDVATAGLPHSPLSLLPWSRLCCPVKHEHRVRLCCPAPHKDGGASAARLPARFFRATAGRSLALAVHSR